MTPDAKRYLTTWLHEQVQSDKIKSLLKFCDKVMRQRTFIQRNKMIRGWSEQKPIEDTQFWS